MDYIMETVGLRKSYKGNVVVNDVNIHVPKGAIYGFVGPNGAGKSTVMKMILNLIQPEAGEVQLFGEKVTDQSYEVFKRVGSIIENPYFYEKMTARQNLELHCDYMGFPNKERIDEVLQMVDLQNVEGKQIRHYSLGMKQRLAIARAILAKPEFLILDEPINALDPEGIREMRNLFQRLNQEDETTIFISSHILSEVDLIADTIGIIQHGNLLAELPGCVRAYRDRYNADHGIIEVTVVSAVPLNDTSREKLLAKLQEMTGKTVRLTAKVDPSILGGLRLDLNGTRLDGTVQRRLERLRDSIGSVVL